MPTDVEKHAYRVDEAAKAYGLSKSKIYRMMSADQLHTVKVGGTRLIPRASLDALLAPNAAEAA